MTQLLVGTKKGLFALEGEAGTPFEVTSRAFAGEPVEFATRDPRSGRYLACVTSAFYGPKVFYTDDLSSEWQQAEGLELPENAEKPLERLWTIVTAEDAGTRISRLPLVCMLETMPARSICSMSRAARL